MPSFISDYLSICLDAGEGNRWRVKHFEGNHLCIGYAQKFCLTRFAAIGLEIRSMLRTEHMSFFVREFTSDVEKALIFNLSIHPGMLF